MRRNEIQVVTSVTYRVHPNPQSFTIGFVQLNATDNATFREVVKRSLQILPSVTKAGYTGYGSMTQGFEAIFVRPNGTAELFHSTFAPFNELAKIPGVNAAIASYPSSWNDYLQTFLTDPNTATNIQDTSRLLTAHVLQHKAGELADFIADSGPGAGFNFSMDSPDQLCCFMLTYCAVGHVNNSERDSTAVHEIWKESHALLSISTNWADNATSAEKKRKRRRMVKLSDQFTEIVGADGGTYINEANPYGLSFF